MPAHCLILDGYPALVVAFVRSSTFTLLSSKVTTASPFSRLTSAFETPSILVNDLFTEITHELHVMPKTASLTVLTSAYAAVESRMTAAQPAVSSRQSVFMSLS
jgi:hypothetical protein